MTASSLQQQDPNAVLDREKALAFTAVAAVNWCERRQRDDLDGSAVLRALMTAAAWTARARAHHGQPALAVHELIDLFAAPPPRRPRHRNQRAIPA